MNKIPLSETTVIEDFLSGMTLEQLHKKFLWSTTTIRDFLHNNGIDTKQHLHKRNSFKYICNEHYLDNLSTEEQFYFLGFFFADGHNGIDQKMISINLQIGDKYILEKFNELFESNCPIKEREKFNTSYNKIQKSVFFSISSTYLVNRLLELGCPQNKSLSLKYPNFISSDFLKDFVRGYFDGDGTIGLREQWSNGPLGRISFCGTKDFLTGLKNDLEKELKIYSFRLTQVTENETYNLDLAVQKDIKKFLEWLYKDSTIYLIRKKEKADIFLTTRNFNIETRLDKSERVSKNYKEIIKLYHQGKTLKELAEYNKCGIPLIRKILKENNVTMRPVGFNLIGHS